MVRTRPGQMKLVAFVGFCCLLLVALLHAENAESPVITIRKGTAIAVDIKEVAGATGEAATSVLRNDIQLSGALALGDATSATAIISANATGASLSGQA